MFEIRDVDLAGRIGRLRTRSGELETPYFFPVVDPARQEVPLSEIRSAGFEGVITNAYLLMKRYGFESAREGVHRILGFEGVVMTDSGAYQILEYGGIGASQGDVVKYQIEAGSDIGVILDIPTGDVDRERAWRTVRETLRRAREAVELIRGTGTLWVLPIQGGGHLDLVEYSARASRGLEGYSIYGIGSPTVFLERYDYPGILRIVHAAKRALPGGRPVHLFGAGHPLIIPFAVSLGVDTFDSASYVLYARDGRYMTDYGVYRVEELDYLPCSCPVCSRLSARELRGMERGEMVRSVALHNLYTIKRSIDRAKQAIREGRLWELLEEVARRHHKAWEALRSYRLFYKYIESQAPRVKGGVKGLRLYGEESLWNPKLLRFKAGAMALVGAGEAEGGEALLLPFPAGGGCPEADGPPVYYYAPYLGVFPAGLCGTYPTTQSDFAEPPPSPIVEELRYSVRAAIHRLRERGFRVRVFTCLDRAWSAQLEVDLRELGVEFVRVSCR